MQKQRLNLVFVWLTPLFGAFFTITDKSVLFTPCFSYFRLSLSNNQYTTTYLPTQKFVKMFPRTSLGVIWPPVISESVSRVRRRSSERRSPLNCWDRTCSSPQCFFLSMIYPIFTLINSIKKGNMLVFVHFFKEKYYLCICI